MNPDTNSKNSPNKLKKRPSIRTDDHHIINTEINEKDNIPKTTKNKSVMWDWKSLEEQEEERKNNPRRKINEPKTPYIPYEEDDCDYMKRLNEVNKTKPTVSIILK